MLLLCIGVALLADSVAMLVLSILAGSDLCLLVVRKEEHYLKQKFGNANRMLGNCPVMDQISMIVPAPMNLTCPIRTARII